MAVNSAVIKSAPSPLRVEMGSISSNAPIKITAANPSTITRTGSTRRTVCWRWRSFLRMSFLKMCNDDITILLPLLSKSAQMAVCIAHSRSSLPGHDPDSSNFKRFGLWAALFPLAGNGKLKPPVKGVFAKCRATAPAIWT